MTLLELAAVFVVSFFYVALRSWQQLNVVRRQYLMIVPTSLMMAAADAFIITSIATAGWGWIVLAFGLGGGTGSICATFLHYRWFKADKA